LSPASSLYWYGLHPGLLPQALYIWKGGIASTTTKVGHHDSGGHDEGQRPMGKFGQDDKVTPQLFSSLGL